jgi:hypothetical protein
MGRVRCVSLMVRLDCSWLQNTDEAGEPSSHHVVIEVVIEVLIP